MKITVSGVEYRVEYPTKPTLAEMLQLTRDTGFTVGDIEAIAERVTPEDTGSSDALFGMGLLLWLARWRAGERLSFEDACNVEFDDVQWDLEPGEKPPVGPTRAPNRATRRSTARSTDPAPRPAKRRASTSPTS